MRSPKQVIIEARADTNVGMVRSVNQDSYLSLIDDGIFAVADGMGGHAGGEVASMLAILAIQNCVHAATEQIQTDWSRQHPDYDVLNILSDAVTQASDRVFERGRDDKALTGMGTTATTLQVVDNYGYIGHVGDSRLYLLRNGELSQITTDHSWVNEQVSAGMLTLEEAESHPYRNVITRSVGFEMEVLVDTDCFEFKDDDYCIICSDGLYGKVSATEIAQTVIDQGIDSVKSLITMANDNGGDDNITVIVVHVQIK